MSKHDFLHSTPNDIMLFMDGIYEQNKQTAKRMEYTAWLNGLYVRIAVASVLGKKTKYPQKPMGNDDNNDGNSGYIVATEAMSEEEKERTRQLFLANLQEMQGNFEGKG